MKKKFTLKTFLLRRSTLIGWTVFVFLSFLIFTLVFHWSVNEFLYFVTIRAFVVAFSGDIEPRIIDLLSHFYFAGNFLVYIFNLYVPLKKYVLDFFFDNNG